MTLSLLGSFCQAMHPDRVIVAGRTLEPLSVGHLLLLARLGHPLLAGGHTVPDLVSLAQAVRLCEVPYHRALRRVPGSLWELWCVWRLGRRLLRARRKAAAAKKPDQDPLPVLTGYLEVSLRRPAWWTEEKEGGTPACQPYWVAVITTLMESCGIAWDDVLDMPATRAQWLCAAVWEKRGNLRLKTEDELQLEQELEEAVQKEETHG